ncbi:MAG: tetraacyldisaccharide 4'-kinase [Pyrinomonadaceae bacterium]
MSFLSPLGWILGALANRRNRLYDRGSFRSNTLGAKTISVGNITVGGTGKTPLVALVAEILAANNEKVCILTRGYGRKNTRERIIVSDGERVLAEVAEGGDEPVELARRLIGKAVVVADVDRVAAAKWAKEKFDITVFVLDDGFQHRRARRDIDIVCIDATNPFGGGKLLPAGRLREPLSNLSRASAVVVTRANLVENADSIVSAVRRYAKAVPVFTSDVRLQAVVRLESFLSGNAEAVEGLPVNKAAMAFCGVGNPESFFALLRQEQIKIAAAEMFRDHYRYVSSDLAGLSKRATHSGAAFLVTTAKDAVKLKGMAIDLPVFVAVTELAVNDRFAFEKFILSS